MRNPNWTRDELILALDLYFRADRHWLPESHLEVIQLSTVLRSLPIFSDRDKTESFRNPNGVSMKLGNFLNVDPNYPGMGLDAGSHKDQEVWDEFADNPAYLHEIAAAIEQGALELTSNPYSDQDSDEETFPEGRILTRLHKERERNYRVTETKKRNTLNKTGKLLCEICGLTFMKCMVS